MSLSPSPVIALVGRPNVGKSTLFNRLAGKKLALVDDQPGVTRDYRLAPAILHGRAVTLMDTAGLAKSDDALTSLMTDQTLRALDQASVLIFVIDGAAGTIPADMEFARLLRKTGKTIILAANKADRNETRSIHNDAHKLGFGAPILISASHGHGIDELIKTALSHLPEEVFVEEAEEIAEEVSEQDILKWATEETPEQAEQEFEEESKSLRMAIVGRPNVGKSTLLNALIGEQRVLTSPVSGTTRDPIAVEWNYQDRKVRLVDTAGLRRRSKVEKGLERMANLETIRIIRLAELVVVVIDATMPFEQQDMTIIQHVFEEGRAMVLVINKWDAVEDKKATEARIERTLEQVLPFIKGIPIITMSALRGGKALSRIMDAAFEQHKIWNKRIGTGLLNRWLKTMIERNPPPLAKGRPNKLRYMTQAKARPPTFALWISQPNELPDSYDRYLINGLREAFKIPGVPIRLIRKKGENPFAGKKSG